MGNVQMEAAQIRYKGQYRNVQEALDNGGGGGGTSDYSQLTNKPSINGVELSGNKSLADLGIQGALTAGSGISIVNNVISATGSAAPVSLRVMSIYSVNDANGIDTTFTAKRTGPHLLIYGFASANEDPEITVDDIKLNGTSVITGNFYNTNGPGVDCKYTVLNLTVDDVVSIAATSGATASNTSSLAVLLKLSASVENISTAAAASATSGSDLLELAYTVNSAGLYMPVLFTRKSGVGAYQYAYQDDNDILDKMVTCSLGSSWQLTLALSTLSAASGDTIELGAVKDGVTALGVLSFDLAD